MDILISVLFGGFGFWVGFLFQKNKNLALKKDVEFLKNQKQEKDKEFLELKTKYEHLLQENTKNETELKNYKENSETQKETFKNLANEILEKNSEKFTNKNQENIGNILKPLQEKIKDFEEKVTKNNKENFGVHKELKQQISDLKNMNEKISKEATDLTKALKSDTKTQGNWGELILENILEKSGLREGKEYFREQNFTIKTEEGSKNLRPDVIVNLPDNRNIIIDSKVSLLAYEKCVNTENLEEKKQFLKAHLQSLKKHIKTLSEKNYENLLKGKSPDFVLMFMPIEPAFALALEEDAHLYNQAFDKNIVIVTPTTLLATLRTIESLWKNQKQQENALEIAQQAGALYDKFVGLSDELITLGKQMDIAKNTYEKKVMVKLTGNDNLVTKSQKIKNLGINTKKQINANLLKRSEN